MSGFLDSQKLGIPCPTCSKKTEKTIGWIKTHDHFTCRCGGVVTLDSDEVREIRRGVREAEGDVADLSKFIKRLNK